MSPEELDWYLHTKRVEASKNSKENYSRKEKHKTNFLNMEDDESSGGD